MRKFLLALVLISSLEANAMSKDGRTFLTMGGYGLVGGTVLGLAQYPFTHNTKNIFVGTSIGLYLGLALGAFYVLNDYDAPKPEPYSLNDGEGMQATPTRASGPYSLQAPLVQAETAVLRF